MLILPWILAGTFFVALIIMGWVVRNLLKKTENQEDIVITYINYLDKLSRVIEISAAKMEEVDHSGTFESDDEVGFFFKEIKEIQGIFNEFIINRDEN